MTSSRRDRFNKLYELALRIRECGEPGLWLPKIQALAVRGHADAMTDLADWYSGDSYLGPASNNFSPAGLYRRAYRKGSDRAAVNLAITCLNRRDLKGYRHWLRKAGRAGDLERQKGSRRFETRLWHGRAHDIGRGRPMAKRDSIG